MRWLMLVLLLGCRREEGRTLMQRDDLALVADKADYIAAVQTEIDRARAAEARLDGGGQAGRRAFDRINAQRGVLQDHVRAIQRADAREWPELKLRVERDLRLMSEMTKDL